MGWASGSQIADDVWRLVRKEIPESKRKRLARKLISIFVNNDCDTIEEAELLIKDSGLTHEELWEC